MYESIKQLGAAAARSGMTPWDCPFYRATSMPHHTGEPIAEWMMKVEAWENGWRLEAQKWPPAFFVQEPGTAAQN